MLKIRLMGTKNDIKWFEKFLQRASQIELLEFSELYPNKGTKKYYRVYAQQEMIEYTTQDVIRFLIEDNHINLERAMELFYLSDTFEKLNDIESGLYLEESGYVYELLKREKQKEK